MRFNIEKRLQEYREENPNGELVWRAPTDLIWCEVDGDREYICFLEPESGHIVDHLVNRDFPEDHPTHPKQIYQHMKEKRWIKDHMRHFDECVDKLVKYNDRLKSDSDEKTRLKRMLERAQMKASVCQMQCREFENLIAQLKPEWWREDSGLPLCPVENEDNPINIIHSILSSADTAWRNCKDWREAARKAAEKLNSCQI